MSVPDDELDAPPATTEYAGTLCRIQCSGTMPLLVSPDCRLLVYRRFRVGVRLAPAGVDIARFARKASAERVAEFRRWEDAQPTWVAAADVQQGDYCVYRPPVRPLAATPTWSETGRRAVHRPAPLDPADEDVAWLFGRFIADGHTAPGRTVVVSFRRSQEDAVERAVQTFGRLGLPATVWRWTAYSHVRVSSSVAANSFREWFGAAPHTKRMPEFLHDGWNLSAVMDGIHGGDRGVQDSDRVVCTTSPRLAVQMHRALIGLGQRPALQPQLRSGGEYPNARPGYLVTWRPSAERSWMVHWRGLYLMPVRRVEQVEYTGPVWAPEVTGEAEERLVWNVTFQAKVGQHATAHAGLV